MSIFDAAYWTTQPLDVLLNSLLLTFGWIPIAVVLFWGFTQMWLNYRQGIYVSKIPYVLLAINVPAITEQTPKALENLFSNLTGSYSNLLWKEIWMMGKLQPVFSFEIASTEGRVQFYVRCQARFRDMVEATIYAQYPEAEIDEVEDYTNFAPDKFPDERYDMWGSEFQLDKDVPQFFPIRTYLDYEDRLAKDLKDPLGQVLEHLAKIHPGEHLWIQFCLQPQNAKWKAAGVKFINKLYGVEEKAKTNMLSSALNGVLQIPNAVLKEAIGMDILPSGPEKKEEDQWKAFKVTPSEREQADAVLRKISKSGWLAKVRVVYVADKSVYNKAAKSPRIKGMFNSYAHQGLNKFSMYGPAVPKDDYFWQRWGYHGKLTNLIQAYKYRSFGIGAETSILNTEELATLWHFPTIYVKAPLVGKAFARRGEAPLGLPSTFEEIPLPGFAPPSPPASLPDTHIDALVSQVLPDLESAATPLDWSPAEAADAVPTPERPTPPSPPSGDVPPNLPV